MVPPSCYGLGKAIDFGGLSMSFINTDGLTVLGPGSEWFWSAFQGVVVAISLWALFRQLRLQTAQKHRDDVARLNAEYQSERLLRHRLAVWKAVRDDTPPSEVSKGSFFALGNFWEGVAGFTKEKHLDAKLMAYHMGSDACWVWTALEPWVRYQRQNYAEDYVSDFEWFVTEIVRIEPTLAAELGQPRSRYAAGVGTLEGFIATEVELRH
jgi:hypothetical protein